MNMSDKYSEAYRILGMPPDATLEELDERYLQLTSYWNGPTATDRKKAQEQQERIDTAYHALFPRFIMSEDEVPGLTKETFTMKQIINNQDRIQVARTDDEDFWIPPDTWRSPSLESTSSDDSDTTSRDMGTAPGFSIHEVKGDIIDAPDRAVLVHSVNCQGVWGYGIAAQLKKAFPQAYNFYRSHCRRVTKPYDLIGTCLLIPPQREDYTHNMRRVKDKEGSESVLISGATVFEKRRWIACLFTSVGYGKAHMPVNNPGKDANGLIVKHTRCALEELRVRLEEHCPSNFNEETNWRTDDRKPGAIWSGKFNSGAFGVDWEDTRAILEEEFRNFERPWIVVEKINVKS